MRFPSTKISIPHLPPDFVPRPDLRKHLEEAGHSDAVVLSAAAGYGKTVLLADWAHHHPGEIAWVTVDAADDDPRRLWAAVRAALAEITEAVAPISEEQHDTAVDDLIAALEHVRLPISLVLDDLHELSASKTLRDVARLIKLRPATLRMVLASRVDPPRLLSGDRLAGRLREVRAEHLRFSTEAAAMLMRISGLRLTDAQVDLLCARTDGWAAGLRLAASALRRSPDPDRLLEDFSGDERSVADYLTGEVLAHLDPDVLAFLRAMSVCAVLPTELASRLAARHDVAAVLDRVRHETGLVTRLSAGEFRIHTLLRSYLLVDLRRRSPRLHSELQARAAEWWADHGDATHALRHAERAADEAVVVELLRRFATSLFLRGELDALRSGLAATGACARNDDPELALLAALVHLDRREREAAAAALVRAQRAWPERAGAGAEALRLSAELLAAAAGLRAPPADAYRAIRPEEPERGALLLFSRGAARVQDAEARAAARPDLAEALTMARAHGFPLLEVQALTMLAALGALQGDIRGMRRHAAEAVDRAATWANPGASPAPTVAAALLAYADLLAARPRQAVERAEEALRLPAALPPEALLTLHAVHAAGRADLGAGVAALAEATAARELGDGIPAEWLAALAVLEHRIATTLGNLPAAADVAEWAEDRIGPVGEILLMKAWTAQAAGHHDAAAAVVAPLVDGTAAAVLSHTRLEALLVLVESQLRGHDRQAGQATLVKALAAGRDLDVVRPFALAGPTCRNLLERWGRRPGRDRFVLRVAEALTRVQPVVMAPLSEREIAVLELLPSLLSAREIAAELSVSVNTVKTHIRVIYGKLGVSSRREAVTRAREHGLL